MNYFVTMTTRMDGDDADDEDEDQEVEKNICKLLYRYRQDNSHASPTIYLNNNRCLGYICICCFIASLYVLTPAFSACIIVSATDASNLSLPTGEIITDVHGSVASIHRVIRLYLSVVFCISRGMYG